MVQSDHLLDLAGALADQVVKLTEQAEVIRRASLVPLATGTLMAEIKDEKRLAAPDPWGSEPLMSARNLAELAFVGAIDHATAFSVGLRNHLIFAPAVAARATAEAAAIVQYLADVGIGPRERVRRLMNERLLSINAEILIVQYLGSSGRPSNPKAAAGITGLRDTTAQLLSSGTKLGYKARQGKGRQAAHFETPRPSITSLIEQLFEDNQGPSDLGRVFYHLTSATAHSYASGLVRNIEPVDEVTPGLTRGQVGLRRLDGVYLTFGVVHALNEAMDTLGRLNGWDLRSDWEPKHLVAFQLLLSVLKSSDRDSTAVS